MAFPEKGSQNLPQTLRRWISRHQQYPDKDQHETPNTLATTHLHRTTNIDEPDVQPSRWPNSRFKVTRSPTLEVPGRDSRGGATWLSIDIARPDVNMAPGTIQRSDAEDDSVLLEPKSTNALTVENLERLQRYLEYFEVLKESRGKAINDWTHNVSAAIRSQSTKDNSDADREDYTQLILRRYREEDEPVVAGPVF